jgi:PHS family inorganic phosphate transporter-like MFS transporter
MGNALPITTNNLLVIAIAYNSLLDYPGLFIALYGLTFFWSNCGPNTTTFVLPSECFPTESRATCHGMSAAAGKVGAVIGASMMAPILKSSGVPTVLYVCGSVAALGKNFQGIF